MSGNVTTEADRWFAAANLNYSRWMGNIQFVGKLAYYNDMHRSATQFGATDDPIGKSAWVWTLGVNLFSMKNGVTGGIAYNQEKSRTNQKNNTLMANINLRF